MPPTTSFGPDQLRSVMVRYHELLGEMKSAINELNVYPVPDGDTGTNMALTVAAVMAESDGARSMDDLVQAIAHGSLMGARGNSGVILSQVLRGFTEGLAGRDEMDASAFVEGLERATSSAYKAVQEPVEGTILTVLREASEAAASDADADLAQLVTKAYEQATKALVRTQEMLPVLSRAGVVDAGGAGLLLLFASLCEVVTGVSPTLPERLLKAKADLSSVVASEEFEEGTPRYEVMLMLDAPAEAVDRLRGEWAALGDSIVVVGGGEAWSCHIHTDHIGPVIEAAVATGRPWGIRVTDLTDKTQERLHEAGAGIFEPRPEALEAPVGVVAVVSGEGLAEIFAELGAQGIVWGGQSMNPSTEAMLSVVESVPASRVVLLPNNKNVIPVAEQINALSVKQVEVVPTRDIPQGVAAMLGYSYAGDDLIQTGEDMAAAASAVVTGEIVRAVRDANVDFGTIAKGDWLGIADGTIVVADPGLESALRGLVAAILPPFAELLTLYLGEGARPPVTKALQAWLAELHPDLQVRVLDGGQPLYPYLISVE